LGFQKGGLVGLLLQIDGGELGIVVVRQGEHNLGRLDGEELVGVGFVARRTASFWEQFLLLRI
jgi:hypothetical protein